MNFRIATGLALIVIREYRPTDNGFGKSGVQSQGDIVRKEHTAPNNLTAAVAGEGVISSWCGEFRLEACSAGELALPSGTIFCGDPTLPFDNVPVKHAFPCGQFPVSVTKAHSSSEYSPYVACITVRFSKETPQAWRATRPWGFHAANDLGCMMDADTRRVGDERSKADPGPYPYFARPMYDLCVAGSIPPRWKNVVLDPTSDLNMIIFWADKGDAGCGNCEFYCGYNDDQVVCFTVETGLILTEDEIKLRS